MNQPEIDDIDCQIINAFQGGFEIVERPFLSAGKKLGLSEDEVIARISRLIDCRALSRFGPMYNAERLGGAVTLCAISVPTDRFDEVSGIVNSHRQVAHNYARDHELNMWFVIACESKAEIQQTIGRIEEETGLQVFDFPKQKEFFIGLKVSV